MKKNYKKYLDMHSRGKSDKNNMFDVVTSCSILDKYIFSKNTFLLLVFKKLIKTCLVSLVVKYMWRVDSNFTRQSKVKIESSFHNFSIFIHICKTPFLLPKVPYLYIDRN